MKLSDYIHLIKNHIDFGPTVIHHRYISPNEGEYKNPPGLPPEVSQVLDQIGIKNFYSHQTESIKLIRKGKHVIMATPTASGKSLVYNISVFEALLKNSNSKAMYLFPLKALEQDQMKNLSVFIKAFRDYEITADIYDGDTTPYRRKKIRNSLPGILFTNPDMLHRGIMAYHDKWKDLFSNLKFVVLDEVHTYR